tara:strand:+ start:4370 stop:4963 length:594 start_codon:yes stop_codon:yes gene_type:complete
MEKKNNEKVFKLENHIGIFDNYILPSDCELMIKYYNSRASFGEAYQRLTMENSQPHQKRDTSINVDCWIDDFRSFFLNFDMALQRYKENTGIHEFYEKGFEYVPMKIQKTLPKEGYHVWHIEHNPSPRSLDRVMAYTVYLNDVEEGGETEFLHQAIRVKPKTGRIVIWPAYYPFVHRGNPPLSGEKYILTSWLKSKI